MTLEELTFDVGCARETVKILTDVEANGYKICAPVGYVG